MKIIAHRGFWKTEDEKNKKSSFIRAFDLGIGTETDLRDCAGKILISHDMPNGDEIILEDLLDIMNGRNLTLALNIKADGLADEIKNILKKYNHTNYFTFDMSIPDMVYQINKEMKIFTGLSDIVKSPILLEKVEGIWLDSFYSDWYKEDIIDRILEENKKVCIVSSDLHKRDTEKQWEIIKKCKYFESDNLILCSDKVKEAFKYFLNISIESKEIK